MIDYGASLNSNKNTITATIETFSNASKVVSPVRFIGQNYLRKRNFEKATENGRNILKYAGRAGVVVSKGTPILFEYNIKQEKVTVTFYVQRYDREDFAVNTRLQTLTNTIAIA